MSTEEHSDFRQDRRQWLKTSASVLGATLLPIPAIAAETQTEASVAPTQAAATAGAKPAVRFFTPAQHAVVEELSETIIPADSHSGGAKAAKVADYIDKALAESFDDTDKVLWREGLRLIDAMSRHYNGKSFVDAAPEDRIAVLTVLSDHEQMTDLPEVRFFIELKRMTVRGYYTSKIGIHDELEYKGNRINQEFVGCDDPGPASS
jgi:glucoside 3-dehydrogenase (cytochrome c) hitch-hiker subunit